MDRAVVAVVAIAVLIASPGVVTAVVDVLDEGSPVVADVGETDAASAADSTDASDVHESKSQNADEGADGDVEVTTGSQLSTVLSTTEDEVSNEVANVAFDERFAAANESERARHAAARAENLTNTAETIVLTYEQATAAYRDGAIDRSTYAQRLATLTGRAESLRSSIERLRDRAADVSGIELASAGYDDDALADASDDLDAVTGAGPSAVHRRFTGRANGSVAVEPANGSGVTIAFAGGAGERSVDVRQDGDDDRNLSVSQGEALSATRDELSDRAWTLTGSTVDGEGGYYEFEFELSTANRTGEAEVRVDGSTGTVVRLEAETEPRDEDDPDERDDAPLVLLVADGEPGPGATITVEARRGDSPVANASVFVDGASVGTTGDDGRLAVTLGTGETEVTAEHGDADADLEFEFDDKDEDDRRLEGLEVSPRLDDGTVTVTVTYEGDAVSGAQVFADGERIGPTGPDGTTSFDLTGEELDLKITRGEFEFEQTYHVADGDLVAGEPGDEADDANETADGNETDDANETEGELALSVVDGDPAPNATVTLEATVDGSPTAGVQVFVDGDRVGPTGSDGRIDVTLGTGETAVTAERGELEAELEFEFDDGNETEADDGNGTEGDDENGADDDDRGNGPPGNGNENPGNGTENPGNGNENPGGGDDDPGNGDESPGNSGDESGEGDENSGDGDDGDDGDDEQGSEDGGSGDDETGDDDAGSGSDSNLAEVE